MRDLERMRLEINYSKIEVNLVLEAVAQLHWPKPCVLQKYNPNNKCTKLVKRLKARIICEAALIYTILRTFSTAKPPALHSPAALKKHQN